MLLAVDTSTRVIGVALYNGKLVLSEVAWISRNHHTVELGPQVAETIDRAGINSADLTAVAVAIGPGSFTGLRIGIAFAKGLAFSRRIPIIGIQTLDALAASQPVMGDKLIAVLKAGRNRLAVGWYSAIEDEQNQPEWKFTGELLNISTEEFIRNVRPPVRVCGEITSEIRTQLAEKVDGIILASPAESIRRPAFIAELAWKRWLKGDFDDPAALKPIYLHHGEPIPG
jgi:tRNA threonylcarbamoyladenosine biosynthesis protein TsaB